MNRFVVGFSFVLAVLSASSFADDSASIKVLASTQICTDSSKSIVIQSYWDRAENAGRYSILMNGEEVGNKFAYVLARYKTVKSESQNGITSETGEAEWLVLADHDNNQYKGDKMFCKSVTVEQQIKKADAQ